MIKLIIFDWDDVFTRGSIKGYYKCYHEAVKGVGVSLPPEEEDRRIKAKWGAHHRELIRGLLKENPELLDKAVKIYEENLFGNTFIDCLTVTPGSQKFLKELAKHYKLAIATGAHPRILRERLLAKFDIPDVFSHILSIYDLADPNHGKPHPFMPNKIMRAENVAKTETILVGDAVSDMQMAWNAGIEPVAVLTGHLSRAGAKKIGVKYIIDDVTKLESVLEQLNAK
ncbi:HAD family hydrolase [Candidatus Saccharibacteria bacterium]|nr:HAD family hydrolase [Candidatus Saccharibacteria bacterium]